MRIFGHEIIVRKQLPLLSSAPNWASSMNGWFRVNEPYAGAWQRNDHLTVENILSNTTVFRCISLIAADIGKMDIELLQEDENGIGQEVENSPFENTLEQPNNYQNSQQFFEQWMYSKLVNGNTYVLKRRDGRNVVNELHVLDPCRVRPLVSPTDGSVFYEIRRDDLAGVSQDTVTIPANEIIHDRWNNFYHPLWGLPPIYAAHLPASQAIRIQKYSDRFFGNAARPSGVLTAPGMINAETAARLKAHWEANYNADNAGKVAVLGDGLKFDPMTQNAVDAELVNQLKLSDQKVCTSFGVPPFKIGIEEVQYDNVEAMDQVYYASGLQTHIKAIQNLLNTGLELPSGYYVEFDLDDLLRMDSERRTNSYKELVGAGILAVNEARAAFDYGPKDGGGIPRTQQQMIPINQPNPSVMQSTRPAPEALPSPSVSARMAAARTIRKGLAKCLT